MSVEVELAQLEKEIELFKVQWVLEKKRVREEKKENKKLGMDPKDVEFNDNLRIARGIWFKPSLRKVKILRRIGLFKQEILANTEEEQPLTRLFFYVGIEGNGDPDLALFLSALRELEVEERVKVTREPGYAHAAVKDALLRDDGTVQRTIPTGPTPSHGFAGAVCNGCRVVRA